MKPNYLSMNRSALSEYLRKNSYTDDFITDFMRMLKDDKINFIQLRFGNPTGCTGFITNDLEYCMETNKKALTEWVYLTDSSTLLRLTND